MSVGRTLFAATLAGMLALTVSPASSQTLRYANQGELKSLDPYTLNKVTTTPISVRSMKAWSRATRI